jgi:ribosomal protein L11 methyltransferase
LGKNKGKDRLKSSTLWIEVSVEVGPDACEAVAEFFDRYGKGGAVIETLPGQPGGRDTPVTRVKAYLPTRQNTKQEKAIRLGLNRLRSIYAISRLKVRLLKIDWTEGWKKGYRPHRIGKRLVITPTWKRYRPKKEDLVILMDPGMAFGTGLHPTTRLCLMALERYLHPGDRILDVGTGSGILTIAAVKLGASHVTALDIEETAVKTAKQNVALNKVSGHVELYTGTLKDLTKKVEPARLIVVNILAYTIIKMLPELKEKLRPGGFLIAGGILAELAHEFENALQEAGLTPVERFSEEDWVTLIAQFHSQF